MKVKVNAICCYAGHSIKPNGSVDLKLKAKYDELQNSIQLLQMLNNDVKVVVKLPNEKPISLGQFRIKSLGIDHDGESVIAFNSTNDFVEVDSLNDLISTELFQARFSTDIEEEEADDNDTD